MSTCAIQIDQENGIQRYILSGSIDDTFKPPAPTGKDLIVSAAAIKRINSIGVKAWLGFFEPLKGKVTVRYRDLSPALVEQFNMISNFPCGGVVESVRVPFLCGGCKTALQATYLAAALKAANLQVGSAKCPKCQGAAEFDDIPEEYFAFLTR